VIPERIERLFSERVIITLNPYGPMRTAILVEEFSFIHSCMVS
jgi:hypothetical protein